MSDELDDLKGQIADLETEIRSLKDDKKALRAELDETQEVLTAMMEHTKDVDGVLERATEIFEMETNEEGCLVWDADQSKVWNGYDALWVKYRANLSDWNKFVPIYNRTVNPPRNFGRPLQASESQVQNVRRLRKEGKSLRGIATATSLTLRTVRTILDQGSDRERSRTSQLRRETFPKMEAADFMAKKRGREYLEKRINSTLKEGAELVKAAKGLGKH